MPWMASAESGVNGVPGPSGRPGDNGLSYRKADRRSSDARLGARGAQLNIFAPTLASPPAVKEPFDLRLSTTIPIRPFGESISVGTYTPWARRKEPPVESRILVVHPRIPTPSISSPLRGSPPSSSDQQGRRTGTRTSRKI